MGYTISKQVSGQEDFRVSGRYYGGNTAGSLSTMPLGANTIRAYPLVVTKPMTISQILSEVTTAAASTTYRVGIYNSDNSSYPASLVSGSDTGTFDSATTGVKTGTFGSSITLTPGLYWFVINTNGTPTLRAIASTGITPVLGVKSTLGTTAVLVGYSASLAYAGLPSSFPSGATDLDTNVNPPLVVVKVA